MTHSFDKDYWDQIWTGDRATAMSSSDPNPHLVEQVGDLTPGTAIDAGCGAGAEAIWLASQGWKVTGADVAQAALALAEDRAVEAGVEGQVDWVRADLSTSEPPVRYDLVTTHYAHPEMSQLDFYDRIASWVAPGGTLLIVGHLHHDSPGSPAQAHDHGHGHGHGGEHGHDSSQPPAEASATAATITDRLDTAVWSIDTAEESQRTMAGPNGRQTTIHDVVVRASRRNYDRPTSASHKGATAPPQPALLKVEPREHQPIAAGRRQGRSDHRCDDHAGHACCHPLPFSEGDARGGPTPRIAWVDGRLHRHGSPSVRTNVVHT
ncbi:class I SAM-dependent methyltransferase [Nocardioides sp. JQ2195]|uniref:class I SAM-dependent methyltransferase n=1 Tax=Nocardioides sp. JQ2195 TaxID=2592334 RepID=UPI00143E2C64|nr:class I SAM-dependent methyltransferase [Nocardioides sp. JQ2195]QIX27585.1 class I SAM-dependent methyltransferase [Nocardioides sp. JQ2195]